MGKQALKDGILNNEAHEERTQAKADKAESERQDRKRRVKARREANASTAFNQLPAEEKQKYSELLKIVPEGRGYTAYQRIDALFAYLIEGSLRGAARLCELSEGTVLGWAQSGWWKSGIVKIRELKQDELDNKYTNLIDRSLVEVADRLENGDERVLKDGKKVRVKVGAKDVMLIGAMAFDKRALLRGNPNSITEKVITVQDRNKILADQFTKIGAEGVKVLEGEFTEEDDNGNV